MKCPHYNKHIKLFYKSKKQNKHPTNNIFLVTHENQRSYVRMSFTFILIQSIRFQKLRKKTFNKKNLKKYLLQMNRLSIPDEPPSSEPCFWTTWFCSLHQWLCATLVTWHWYINGVFIRFQWPESAIPGTGLASKLKSNIHADVAEYQEYFIKQDRAR